MNREASDVAAVSIGIAYLLALAWSMSNLSYDIWGVLVVAPIYGLLGLALVRRMFPDPSMRPTVVALSWGMLFKLFGAFARYWVGFEAYDGGIDAGRYHDFALRQSGEVWSGERSVSGLIPTKTGTEFVDEFTAIVYTLTGGSQLAGFVTFSFMAFVGIAFFVKAAVVAVPGLAAKKYAWLCVLAPSLVYWPSSIGKEAIVLMGLGIGSYGVAMLLARQAWFSGVFFVVLGLGFTALIRPHMSGIWLGAALPGLLVATIVGSRDRRGSSGRVGMFILLGVAAVGFAILAKITVEFLQLSRFEDGPEKSVADILEETTRRTSQAGSNFVPPSIDSPLSWPYAIVRTLTRPLPIEASGLAQLISALEMTLFFLLVVCSWKRVKQLPRMLISNPYVVFSVSTLILAGLAYTSLANLGVLTRQKSLLFPFLLLIPCLPRAAEPAVSPSEQRNEQEASKTSINIRERLAIDDESLNEFWDERVR